MKSYAQIQLQLSNLQYDEIPLKRCEKRAKNVRNMARAIRGWPGSAYGPEHLLLLLLFPLDAGYSP